MELQTNTTRTTYNSVGSVQVRNAIRIMNVSHTSGQVKDLDDVEYNGVIDIRVSYLEIDAQGNEFEISGRNDLDNRIVRALEVRDNYIFGLDQTPFNGLTGYARMEKTAYYFLRKHCIDVALFGITDINEWDLI